MSSLPGPGWQSERLHNEQKAITSLLPPIGWRTAAQSVLPRGPVHRSPRTSQHMSTAPHPLASARWRRQRCFSGRIHLCRDIHGAVHRLQARARLTTPAPRRVHHPIMNWFVRAACGKVCWHASPWAAQPMKQWHSSMDAPGAAPAGPVVYRYMIRHSRPAGGRYSTVYRTLRLCGGDTATALAGCWPLGLSCTRASLCGSFQAVRWTGLADL